MQPHVYGAHEVMELHEILNGAVDAINTAQLYAPYARDPELVQLLRHQLQFMETEYNSMVQTIRGLGAGEGLPYRPISSPGANASAMPPAPQAAHPTPSAQQPNTHPNQMDDRDVSSAMLGLHKSGAVFKMAAALEAAHPQIRSMLLQSAVNCANQAYETWNYMKRKGYYPLVAMPESVNAQLLKGYQPTAGMAPGAIQQMAPGAVTPSVQQNGTLFTNSVEPEGPLARHSSMLPGMAVPGAALQQPQLTQQPQFTQQLQLTQQPAQLTQQPMQASPLSMQPPPANASQIFSSPQYRQEHYGGGDELGMAAEPEATMASETYGSASVPPASDSKQKGGRKKSAADPASG